ATGKREDKLNALIAAARADTSKPVQVESDRSNRACYLARVAPAKATPGAFELGVLAYSFAKGYPVLIFVATENSDLEEVFAVQSRAAKLVLQLARDNGEQ